MLAVSCAELGLTGCDFVATAKNDRKLESMMLEHIRDEHPTLVAGITYEQHRAMEKNIALAAHEVSRTGTAA